MSRRTFSLGTRLEVPRFLCIGLLAHCILGAPVVAQDPVTFVVNDAFIKDELIADVAITLLTEDGVELKKGVTDERGAWQVELPPSRYQIRFLRAGYVPLATEVEISRAGQIVTTSLSKLLEAEGHAERRRIRIILNWGSDQSQVKDADSHLQCACPVDDPHVFFAEMEHEHLDHRASLDVDDMDWGGPETVTILDPPPGEYIYWVHDYSGPPAVLGSSDIAVRVLHGDRVIGDYEIPADIESRAWRPFAAIEVDQFGAVGLRKFSDEEIVAGLDRAPPVGYDTQGQFSPGLARFVTCGIAFVSLLVIAIIVRVARR